MFDYAKGFVFIPLFLYVIAAFGRKIHKSDCFSENLIYGYVYYTCLQFIGGFISQTLRLPWVVFRIYMIVLIIFMLILIFYKQKTNFSIKPFITHFKKYWMIYGIACIFVIFACMNIQYLWNANLVDDGYYLNKIRMAPYVENYADFNYAVGYSAPGSIIRNINTFEIEAAFFTQLLGMDASIYAKVFLSFMNYTLVLHTIYWFYKTLAKGEEVKWILFALVPMLFFGINQEILSNYKLLYLQDSWHFNTAMWYGSALVRCLGVFLLATPFLKDQTITKEKLFFACCSSVALFSKATQALPIIYLLLFAYGLPYTIKCVKNKKLIFIGVALLIAIMACIPLIDVVQVRAGVIQTQLSQNASTLIIKVSIFLLAVSYTFDLPRIRKWNNFLLLMGLFMFIPRINSLFLYLSVYDFVAARTVSAYFFALIVTAFLNAYIILQKFINNRKELVALYGSVALVLIGIPLIGIQRNLGIAHTVQILLDNPNLIPSSTMELGASLERISKEEGKELNVLTPRWLVLDGTPHAISAMVRYNAFDIHSIGTIPRYDSLNEDNLFQHYTEDEHVNFEFYHSGEQRDKKAMAKLLSDFPEINCIVVYYDDVKDAFIKDFDMVVKDSVKLSDQFHSYYIMMRK